MKRIIEITNFSRNAYSVNPRLVPLKQADGKEYVGICSDMSLQSSCGSYIDFPGHIDITDNGLHAGNADILDFYRRDAWLVRPERTADGAVTLQALQKACADMPESIRILVVDILRLNETREPAAGAGFLELDAADWLGTKNLTCVVADIYEKREYEGVFYHLFRRGISCVCAPDKLWLLPERELFKLSVIFLPATNAVQTPCRMIAEVGE